jgi:hypothetical protein
MPLSIFTTLSGAAFREIKMTIRKMLPAAAALCAMSLTAVAAENEMQFGNWRFFSGLLDLEIKGGPPAERGAKISLTATEDGHHLDTDA